MQSDHERARYLIDETHIARLSEGDAAWLCNHTGRCVECAEYSAVTSDVLQVLRSMSFDWDAGINRRVKDTVVARIHQAAAKHDQPSTIFGSVRHAIRQCVMTPSRQLALTTAILVLLAAPSVYQAVRDRQQYTYIEADDQLLLDNIEANVSRTIPEVLEPLLQPLSPEKSYGDGKDHAGRSR